MKKKRKKSSFEDVIKGLHLGGRLEQFERNGGGQWVATNRPHRNKKKYDRKRMPKLMGILSFKNRVIFSFNVFLNKYSKQDIYLLNML